MLLCSSAYILVVLVGDDEMMNEQITQHFFGGLLACQ
jgi:hypothetical protein